MGLKEELLQYCDIQKEIKELEEKIEKLNKNKIISDSVRGTSKYFPYIEKSYKIEGLDIEKQKKIDFYKTILQERYDRLLEKQIEIEEFIDKLPTSRLRRIFEYRYIEQYSWVKVANKIDNRSTADSIRMEHDRFLEKK